MPKVNKTNLKDKANKNNSKNKVNKNKLKNKVNKSNLTDKAKRKDKTSGNESKSSSQLQTYNKRKFVEILKGTNCNPNKEDRLIEKFKNIDGIAETRDYINNHASTAQERITYVMQKEGNKKFINLNNWAQYFCKTKPIHQLDNSMAMILEMIAKTEEFPNPEALNGIDLKKVYSTLVNLMVGYPTEELNTPSKEFLKNCFQELLENVNSSNDSSSELTKLKEIVVGRFKEKDNGEKGSQQTNSISEDDRINKLLSHEEINPLQLPSQLCLK